MNDSSSSIAADRCVLCLDQKRSPVRIQCGHSFCYDCLDVYKSYQKHAWANRCPICRGQLKEKKRAVKRKYSTTTNASSENSTSNPTSTITSPLSDNQADSYEQIFMLEEFMAWAAGYNNSESQDGNNAPDEEGSYVALDNTEYDDEANNVTDLVDVDAPDYDDDDDYYDDYYDDYDDDFYDNGDNDQDDVVDFSTDSDDDENNYYYQFSEDVTQEYYHSTADVDESMAAQSPLQQQQQHQHQQELQQQHDQQFMFRDCNNNVSNASSFIDSTIDWEEAIEVIIID